MFDHLVSLAQLGPRAKKRWCSNHRAIGGVERQHGRDEPRACASASAATSNRTKDDAPPLREW
jgi:hypothetical protein